MYIFYEMKINIGICHRVEGAEIAVWLPLEGWERFVRRGSLSYTSRTVIGVFGEGHGADVKWCWRTRTETINSNHLFIQQHSTGICSLSQTLTWAQGSGHEWGSLKWDVQIQSWDQETRTNEAAAQCSGGRRKKKMLSFAKINPAADEVASSESAW